MAEPAGGGKRRPSCPLSVVRLAGILERVVGLLMRGCESMKSYCRGTKEQV